MASSSRESLLLSAPIFPTRFDFTAATQDLAHQTLREFIRLLEIPHNGYATIAVEFDREKRKASFSNLLQTLKADIELTPDMRKTASVKNALGFTGVPLPPSYGFQPHLNLQRVSLNPALLTTELTRTDAQIYILRIGSRGSDDVLISMSISTVFEEYSLT